MHADDNDALSHIVPFKENALAVVLKDVHIAMHADSANKELNRMLDICPPNPTCNRPRCWNTASALLVIHCANWIKLCARLIDFNILG